jgi:hypothetical protein
VVYITLGIICLYDFGTALDANVLTNVDEEKGSIISYIIRVSFLIVLACHIPYIFYTGKESLLIFIVETVDKQMSRALEMQEENTIRDGNNQINPDVEQQGEIKKMFEEMPAGLYYSGTLALYAVEIVGAILITDLSTIFDFIGGISLSAI